MPKTYKITAENTKELREAMKQKENMRFYKKLQTVALRGEGNGDKFFLVLPNCNTACMNVFLRELSALFPKDYLLLGADNAVWHKAKSLEIPDNIRFFYLPPRTPELNPIEQIWKEVRKRGFKNKIFKTLDKVVDHLCDTLNSLTNDCIKSITGRDWILQMF